MHSIPLLTDCVSEPRHAVHEPVYTATSATCLYSTIHALLHDTAHTEVHAVGLVLAWFLAYDTVPTALYRTLSYATQCTAVYDVYQLTLTVLVLGRAIFDSTAKHQHRKHQLVQVMSLLASVALQHL